MRLLTSGNLGFIFLLTSVLLITHSKIILKGDRNVCEDVEIVPREEWRARPPIRRWEMKMPVNDVIIHHTVSPECHNKPQCLRNIYFIQEYHVDDQGWFDIGYNFVVGNDGRVYEAIGWTQTGAHSINFNTNSLGVAFIGDYRKVAPNPKMLDAARKLFACGVQKGYLTPTWEIHGHKDVACGSESPGEKLYEIIRTWDNYKGGRLPNSNC